MGARSGRAADRLGTRPAEIFGLVRKYSHEYLKWPVRLDLQHLWSGKSIANQATPAAILLLERADVAAPKLIPVDHPGSTINDLLEMNFGEAGHFLALLKKAGQLDEVWLAAWKESERALMMKTLADVPAYRLALPYSQAVKDVQTTLMPILENLAS
jgi:hypothetical protein